MTHSHGKMSHVLFFYSGMKTALKLQRYPWQPSHEENRRSVRGASHHSVYCDSSPKATHLNSRVATRWMENNRRQFHLQCDFVHDFPASLWQHEDAFIVSYATTALCAKINTTLQTVGVFLEIFHTRECPSWSLTKQAPLLATAFFFFSFSFFQRASQLRNPAVSRVLLSPETIMGTSCFTNPSHIECWRSQSLNNGANRFKNIVGSVWNWQSL